MKKEFIIDAELIWKSKVCIKARNRQEAIEYAQKYLSGFDATIDVDHYNNTIPEGKTVPEFVYYEHDTNAVDVKVVD